MIFMSHLDFAALFWRLKVRLFVWKLITAQTIWTVFILLINYPDFKYHFLFRNNQLTIKHFIRNKNWCRYYQIIFNLSNHHHHLDFIRQTFTKCFIISLQSWFSRVKIWSQSYEILNQNRDDKSKCWDRKWKLWDQ